jgi:hypothetical protein
VQCGCPYVGACHWHQQRFLKVETLNANSNDKKTGGVPTNARGYTGAATVRTFVRSIITGPSDKKKNVKAPCFILIFN